VGVRQSANEPRGRDSSDAANGAGVDCAGLARLVATRRWIQGYKMYYEIPRGGEARVLLHGGTAVRSASPSRSRSPGVGARSSR